MTTLESSRRICRDLARKHYENFPVGRFGVPKDRRDDIHAIYAFARIADDFADEPEFEGRRIELLEDWQRQLDRCDSGSVSASDHPVFTLLAETIRVRDLPVPLLSDLLSAFKQDVSKQRYESWEEVTDYCRRSANPVGRLVLRVCGQSRDELLPLSDALCTGLQLANFWQDLSVDHARGKSYIPADAARRHGVDIEALVRGVPQPGFPALFSELVVKSRALFDVARPLPGALHGGLRLEIAATWHGGRTILERAAALGERALRTRPKLSGFDKLLIIAKGLRGRA